MIGFELACDTADSAARLVRALGKHRYVLGREHLIHAFALDACRDVPELAPAAAWAAEVLADPSVERGSRDPRLQRRCSDDEVAQVLACVWSDAAAAERLTAHLESIGVRVDEQALPFDEQREGELFPALIDAGWELLPLNSLERERHAGVIRAIDAQGADADYEVACFDESSQLPPQSSLLELPLMGPTELLCAWDEYGDAAAPFVVWGQGHPVYLDYLMRGVAKVAGVALLED